MCTPMTVRSLSVFMYVVCHRVVGAPGLATDEVGAEAYQHLQLCDIHDTNRILSKTTVKQTMLLFAEVTNMHTGL